MEERDATRVQSVTRAIELLRAVARADASRRGVPALAAACGLNRATAWRLLKTLQAEGMVALDQRGGYVLGLTVTALASSVGHDALVAVARPVLAEVSAATGETAALAVPGVDGLTYIDEVIPRSVLTASWLGRSVPLHATSTGKAWLAFLPEAETRQLLRAGVVAHTPTTITDPDDLAAELSRTRARGYGTCAGELESTLFGVSAPVLNATGRPVAVLSLWGPGGRVGPDRFDALGTAARSAASQIARELQAFQVV